MKLLKKLPSVRASRYVNWFSFQCVACRVAGGSAETGGGGGLKGEGLGGRGQELPPIMKRIIIEIQPLAVSYITQT